MVIIKFSKQSSIGPSLQWKNRKWVEYTPNSRILAPYTLETTVPLHLNEETFYKLDRQIIQQIFSFTIEDKECIGSWL